MRQRASPSRLPGVLFRWPLALVALGLAAAANAPGSGLRVNWTASAPIGLYRSHDPNLSPGALAIVCLRPELATLGLRVGYLPAGVCPGDTGPALKQIAALPGDTVTLGEAFLAVNGRILTRAPIRRVDSRGRPLEHVPFGHHEVSQGQVWVLGVNPDRSWDSRYFGPIPVESIVGSAQPLLTLNGGRR
jgi:conjugative transfer signal peptidase TraF